MIHQFHASGLDKSSLGYRIGLVECDCLERLTVGQRRLKIRRTQEDYGALPTGYSVLRMLQPAISNNTYPR